MNMINKIKMFAKSLRNNPLLSTCSSISQRHKAIGTTVYPSKEQVDHPEYPSLLSLTDVFAGYSIKNTVIRKEDHFDEDVETPFIYTIEDMRPPLGTYTLVLHFENVHVTFMNTREHLGFIVLARKSSMDCKLSKSGHINELKYTIVKMPGTVRNASGQRELTNISSEN